MSSPNRAALKNSKEVVDQLNEHPNTLEFDLKSLINLPQFSYLTFLVGPTATPFYAHTAVLAARCQFFFFKFLTPSTTPTEPIALPDIKPVVFSAFLCFIYTDTLKYIDDEDAPDLFNLARRFQVKNLLLCRTLLNKNHGTDLQRLPTLAGDLFKVLNRKEFSDVTFVVEGKEFHASQALLSCRSVYFSSMFCGPWREPREGRIEVFDVPASTFSQVLRFVYTDTISPASVHEALDLFQLAKFYGLPALGTACERYYAAHLTPESVCDVWDFAVEEQMSDVSRHCLSFVVRNFSACARTPAFMGLPRYRLRQVLESGQVEMDTDDLVSVILRWAQSNISPAASLAAVADLMPPAVLFNTFNRRYLLGEPVAILW